MLAPTIEKLAEQYGGRAAVYKVSVDRCRSWRSGTESRAYRRCCSFTVEKRSIV
jgi:hypothetical protein